MDINILLTTFLFILAAAWFIYIGGIWLLSTFVIILDFFSTKKHPKIDLFKNDWMWSLCMILATIVPMHIFFRIAIIIAASITHTKVKNSHTT